MDSDLHWPEDPAQLPLFGLSISSCLVEKGWCLVNARQDEDVQITAVEQAKALRYESVKTEFLADLLGEAGSGKICHLIPDALSSNPHILDIDAPSQDCISCYDRDVTTLCTALKPFTSQRLGFIMSGRTEGMVWAPYATPREEEKYKPETILEGDIEDGLVEVHLHFLRRRRLTCLYFIDAAEEKLELFCKDKEERTHVQVASGSVLIFCCDRMSYKFDPVAHFLALQAWILEDPVQLQTLDPDIGEDNLNATYGILSGVGVPLLDRVCTTAMAYTAGGGIDDDVGGDRFATMLSAGCDGSFRVPNTRFDTDIYFSTGDDDFEPGRTSYCHHGAFCKDDLVFEFDCEFWGIDPDYVKIMWPKQRVGLDVGYSALHAAGWTRETIRGKQIPVYVGDCAGDWFSTLLMNGSNGSVQFSADWNEGASVNITATRLSYILGLRGAAVSIDTACSSGLSAYALSAKALQETTPNQRLALCAKPESSCVGSLGMGNQITSGPGVYIGNSMGHMLSHRGRCFTYDVSADGYSRGEGVGACYNKRVKDNVDKVEALGLCVGSCMNQDGRSATMTAPNGPAQQECTRHSMAESGLAPGEVSVCENHGTGTPLGDPIEVGACMGVFRNSRIGGRPFQLTSLKANLGHQEDNAGLAGLIKCILMNNMSAAALSPHLRTLNPNLDATGCPCQFATDSIDLGSHASVCGVSSFGFGGANANVQMWGRTRYGQHYTAKRNRDCQRTITCPITLGQVDYLTGEPVSRLAKSSSDGPPAVLREPLADYEISRYAYSGGFRLRWNDAEHFRDEDEAEEDQPEDNPEVGLPDGSFVCACGSWTGWTKMDQMTCDENGWHSTMVVLGETRCESFLLCLDGDAETKRFLPVADKASAKICVQGPGNSGIREYCWMIDGRDEEIPVGTVYKVQFRYGKTRKQVLWKIVSPSLAGAVWPHQHTYSVVGTWTSWKFADLRQNLDEEGLWEGDFRIGNSGQELLQFARDHDRRQLLYPSVPNATQTSTPVRGPDDMGSGKYWLIRGHPDEVVSLRLSFCDGQIEVHMSSPSRGSRIWTNITGWGRHDYYLKTSWSENLLALTMNDRCKPGIFTCIGEIRSPYSEEFGACVEHFQVVIDEDVNQCMYPMATHADSGKYITCGPDGSASTSTWMVRGLCPGERFEVALDLTTDDRRKMVTWRWVEIKTIPEQVAYFQQLSLQD